MRNLFILPFVCIAITASAQKKIDYTHYDKLIEVEGTDYVYATTEHIISKGGGSGSTGSLMFINTHTGETNPVDFPLGSDISSVHQLKYDSLHINKMLVIARTVDLNDKSGINYNDPSQVIIVSADGKQKTVLTADGFFTRYWNVYPKYGTIVIIGYYDSNENGRLDRTDKSEVMVYDLKNMKILSKT
ncbi:MAG: hypothetical protein JST82_01020 [Bacteroidetes bacterium]|nr:hypothetical protein [Bacteroidota bacterium]